jgi:hypothetical protein
MRSLVPGNMSLKEAVRVLYYTFRTAEASHEDVLALQNDDSAV